MRRDDRGPVDMQDIEEAFDRLWRRGWTPADLVHVLARERSDAQVAVVAGYLVADGHRRVTQGQRLHPRWVAQLTDLAEWVSSPPMRAALTGADDSGLVALLGVLAIAPPLPRTMPAPGERWNEASSPTGRVDARMLGKVRALLAKAESTTFEAEAEAFTAKAQELITRHAIDDALLHSVDDVGEPSVRRIHLDDPYLDAKAALVARVGAANRCRLVSSIELGWVTAFGYDHDLDALELLSASLLTQATRAMTRHGSVRDVSGRSRTRSFRRAFLIGFAHRIGERLQQAADEQVAAATGTSGALVPVFAAREERVVAAQREAFPHLIRRATSVSNGYGWDAGRAAAEVADLTLARDRLPPVP